jgi:hypothetical protein
MGDRVELVCEVFGAPQATVFWTFNGRPIASSPVVGADEEHLLNAGKQLIGKRSKYIDTVIGFPLEYVQSRLEIEAKERARPRPQRPWSFDGR